MAHLPKGVSTTTMERQSGILEFERPASFYYKRAQRLEGQDQLPEAVANYYQALRKQPANLDYLIGLATLLMHMGRYEQSNSVYFSLMAFNRQVPESFYFGLACNYLGLGEIPCAEGCLQRYLQLSSDLDEDPQNEIFRRFVLERQQHLEAEGLTPAVLEADQARRLMERGKTQQAVELLQTLSPEDFPRPGGYYNSLSLAHFYNADLDAAICAAQTGLEQDPRHVQLMCNLALFYRRAGRREEVDALLDEALSVPQVQIEDQKKLMLTLCEIKRDEEALSCAQALLRAERYDSRVLHCAAAIYYNLGQYDRAHALWLDLTRLDPQDTVAEYYLALAYERMEHPPERRDRAPFLPQVPAAEVLRRIHAINERLEQCQGRMNDLEYDEDFQRLLLWGQDFQDPDIKRAVMHVAFLGGRPWGERLLRRYLLKLHEPELLQRYALVLLKQMGAPEPYLMALEEGLSEVTISLVHKAQDPMDELCGKVLEECMAHMRHRYPDRKAMVEEVAQIWFQYVSSRRGKRGWLRNPTPWAAALEVVYCKQAGIPALLREVAAAYGVRADAISRRARMMLQQHKGE